MISMLTMQENSYEPSHASDGKTMDDIGHFHSGSGFHEPSWLRRVAVSSAFFMGRKVTSLVWQADAASGDVRSAFDGISKELQVLHATLRLGRMDINSLSVMRQTALCCLARSLPCVQWKQVVFGDVPGWSCSTEPRSVDDDTSIHSDPKCLLVYVHGGGLCSGDAGCFQGICSRLSLATGRSVLIPHYRLCPESSKHDAVEDLVSFLVDVSLQAQGGAAGIVAVADSAGGYVVHAASQDSRCAPLLKHLILMSPMLGLVSLDDPRMDELEKTDVVISRNTLRWVYGVAAIDAPEPVFRKSYSTGSEELPPYASNVTVFAAEAELLCLDARQLVESLRLRGGINVSEHFAPGPHVHAWPTMAGLGVPECDLTLAHIAQIIRESDR